MSDKIEQYNIKNLMDRECSFCEGLNKIYNLKTKQYKFEISKETGNGYFRQIASGENIQVIDFDMTFCRHMEVEGMSRTPHVDMFFCIGDGIEWGFHGRRSKFELLNGDSFLAKTKNKENVKRCIYPSGHKFQFIEVKIHPKKFKQIIQSIENEWRIFCKGKYDEIFYKCKITPSITVVLQQMINCPYEKGLRDIYMEGKIFELFAIYLNEAVYQREKRNLVKLSKEDISSIYKAQQILNNNITAPPSITSLSKMVCLNEFKLKNGFKEIFGETIYAYVIDRRLETAQLLFEEKNMQVSEVASMVGYANMSHFALAFRKKFGINPGEYLRNVVKQ